MLVTGIDFASISTIFLVDLKLLWQWCGLREKSLSFLCSVLYTIVCPIIHFLLAIALPVIFLFTASDYSPVIFRFTASDYSPVIFRFTASDYSPVIF